MSGVSGAIGSATALALARAGARVALLDPDPTAAARAVGQIEAARGEARAIGADPTDGVQVEEAFSRVVGSWGRLDVLVNAADSPVRTAADHPCGAAFREALDVAVRATVVCTQAAIPHLRARGRGRILSGTSVWARCGGPGLAADAAAKAAVIGLTRTWARELGPAGITANCVAPGLIGPEAALALTPDDLAEALARIPARRLGTAEEVAGVYLFLASDLASFVNGAVVGVDGGFLLY